jgi:hypothetical protein
VASLDFPVHDCLHTLHRALIAGPKPHGQVFIDENPRAACLRARDLADLRPPAQFFRVHQEKERRVP